MTVIIVTILVDSQIITNSSGCAHKNSDDRTNNNINGRGGKASGSQTPSGVPLSVILKPKRSPL